MTVPLRCLVIDPESAGLDLVRALRERGAEVFVRDQRTPLLLEKEGSTSTPDVDLVEFAEQVRPDHVLAGSESSVSAAEWISDHLGTPASPLRSAHARRDKNGMVQAVRAAGLACMHSLAVESVDGLRLRRSEVSFPAFVKPAASAGSDRCRAVDSWEELESAVLDVLQCEPIMGIGNESVVVQDFVDGPQFFVNAVTVAGQHIVTDVFDYRLRVVDGSPHLFAGRSYALDDPFVEPLVEYVTACLDALDVREGASHTEIRVSSTGPVLIEVNARLMGPMQPAEVFVPAQGYSQATLWATALVEGAGAARDLVEAPRPRACVGWYLLSAVRSGVVDAVDASRIEGLPSFRAVHGLPEVGADVVVTNRTTTADLGIVHLVDASVQRVEDDLLALGRLEEDGRVIVVKGSEEDPLLRDR